MGAAFSFEEAAGGAGFAGFGLGFFRFGRNGFGGRLFCRWKFSKARNWLAGGLGRPEEIGVGLGR